MHVVVGIVRILALFQRKTLIETKDRTLKRLKWHYSTVRSMKNVAVLTEDRAFVLFFRPHRGGFDSSRVLTPGSARGGGGLGAAGIDCCIIGLNGLWTRLLQQILR